MTKSVKSAPAVKSAPVSTTKDSGAVKIGGAAIRFASTKDAGKVHVGGAAMRF